MKIENIVFDVGNVLVKWEPQQIIKKVFSEDGHDNLVQKIFKSSTWYDLNLGKLSEKEAIQQYHKQLGIPENQLKALMFEVKHSQIPMEGSFELLEELYHSGVPLYSITDNVKETISFLKDKYHFFEQFRGVVISAEIGALKPSKTIYSYFLSTYQLKPECTVFFDDVWMNVEGAKQVGMLSYQFTDALSCRKQLRTLGFSV